MFSILISVIATAAVLAVCFSAGAKTGTAVFFGITAFFVAQFVTGFFVRKRIKGVQDEMQDMLKQGQQRIMRKIQQFQNKPGANPKMVQRLVEKDQQEIYKKALDFTAHLEPFKKWSPFMGRQIATMRLQFHYQLKEFEQVDQIFATHGFMKGPMLADPMTVAMKMARQYKNKDIEGVEKTFKKQIKWFRGNKGKLPYGVLSWVYVKEGRTDEARSLLAKAKDSTGEEAFSANWVQLSNNNVKNFSNAGLGEEWFGLYLENPPMPKQKMVRPKGGNMRGF